jgi:hypothetical protein
MTVTNQVSIVPDLFDMSFHLFADWCESFVRAIFTPAIRPTADARSARSNHPTSPPWHSESPVAHRQSYASPHARDPDTGGAHRGGGAAHAAGLVPAACMYTAQNSACAVLERQFFTPPANIRSLTQ